MCIKCAKCQACTLDSIVCATAAEPNLTLSDAGISIRFMNSNLQGDNIRDSISAANLLARCQFSGMTPLGTQMHARILKPMVEAAIANCTLQKPVLVITITDGEPTSEPESKIVKVIKNMKAFASKSQYGSGAVAFEFAQVRRRLLERLSQSGAGACVQNLLHYVLACPWQRHFLHLQ